ncbi:hypothetical protein [Streptomyces avermitilis]|uniref:hypothetical protein n=1 Tax=Streptomyces avermitilis TaxID=33903 RepID=UPI00339DCA10
MSLGKLTSKVASYHRYCTTLVPLNALTIGDQLPDRYTRYLRARATHTLPPLLIVLTGKGSHAVDVVEGA